MGHLLRRITNLSFAFLLAVMSVNLSGVLSLQNAFADAPGNNGTLKVHELNTPSGSEPTPGANNNDPKVCIFNFEGFGLDASQTGNVTIEGQGNTTLSPSVVVPFASNNLGYGETVYINNGGVFTLADGHYKATLDDKFGVDNGNKAKSKVFKVDCPETAVTQAPTKFADPCGTLNDFYTIPNVVGVDYFVNNVKKNPGNYSTGGLLSVTVTAVAQDGYVLSGSATWTLSFTNESCIITVTPTLPTFTDICQTSSDTYTVPSTTGVTYKVNGVVTQAGTYNATFWHYIIGVTITAHAANGNYVLQNGAPKTWSYTFTNNNCPATVTAPTKNDACGAFDDQYVIPASEGVIYKVKVGQVYLPLIGGLDAGSYSTLGASSITIKAYAKSGYTLGNQQTEWTLTFNTANCPVVANAPEFVDPCGSDGDKFTIPTAEHVTYKKLTGWFLIFPIFTTITAGEYTGSGFVKIIAVADAGYDIDGNWFWVHNFNSNKCELPAVSDPTFSDPCGVDGDSYTIEAATGVTYKVNGTVTPAGTYNNATGLVEITAEATDPDYVLTGDTVWSHDFSTATCPDITATAFCDREGVIVTLTNAGGTDGKAWVNGEEFDVPANDSIEVTVPLTDYKAEVVVYAGNEDLLIDNDFDCTPGRGGAGGEQPTTPVLPAGIMLPQTGVDPMARIFSIIVAGIFTYGAMFYLMNRRDLASKK